ncbi:MAG: nucleotidyltransferase family protein [Acidimicrobiales bacterium]
MARSRTGHDAERAVAGVVLAAGEGWHFGGPKALVRFAGEMLVERSIRTLAQGGCRPVCVVLGAAAAEVQAACDLADAVVVVNGAWPDGMGGSLRVGLESARQAGAGAALVALVDQPLVTPALVARLIAAWRGGARAPVAAWRGEGLTPALLDRSLWEVVALHAVGDVGARAVLRAQPELVTLVDCDDVGAPDDIDTPADLRRLEGGRPQSPAPPP